MIELENQHTTFIVEGMTCDGCVKTIKEILGRLNGIFGVIVDLDAKRVAVEYDAERLDVETIKGTIDDAGYKVK